VQRRPGRPVTSATAARPSHAASPAPAATGTRTAYLGFRRGTLTDTARVFGTSVRFTTEKAVDSLTVVDNDANDLNKYAGGYTTKLAGGAMFYRAQVLTVPVGYELPTETFLGEIGTNGAYVQFKDIVLKPKKVLQISFFNRQKMKVTGGSVVVTAPGSGPQWVITDGGAGDLTPMGMQAPADGVVNVYMPSATIATWTICETAPPTGYMMAEPACQTVQNNSGPKLSVGFMHETGIIVGPSPM
jgi:hypothetical protein